MSSHLQRNHRQQHQEMKGNEERRKAEAEQDKQVGSLV